MFIRLTTLVLSIIVAWYIYGILTQEKCQDILYLNNFNMEKAKGIWYLFQTSSPIKKDRKCYTVNVTWDEDNKKGVVQEKWLHDREKQSIDVNVFAEENKSYFMIQWGNLEPKRSWAIGFEYQHFLSFYICWPGHNHGGVLFIWTREKRPGETVVEAIRKSIIDAKFTFIVPFLYNIDHSDCKDIMS